MTAPAQDITDAEAARAQAEHEAEKTAEWWSEPAPKSEPFNPVIPPELEEWCQQRAADKEAQRLIDAAICATCGLPRGHADHQLTTKVVGMVRCRFVEVSE